MKFTPKTSLQKFQMGGEMGAAEAPVEQAPAGGAAEAPEAAPAEGAEQDPMMMLAQMSAQAIQSGDCQMAMQVCQGFLQIIQQMQGGAPQEPQGEPVFRKGGVLSRRIKK